MRPKSEGASEDAREEPETQSETEIAEPDTDNSDLNRILLSINNRLTAREE